ncbi:uncharacterized protein LOC131948559 [Physella acuta]|uniref:uncharacterized protein LOC131948559 n=1 Tax=Physella acuta TaxID=109671 RepID=UPI0027DDBA0F|nr:uncharacterized protein LOC131948559 [Physella acuta]
MKMSNSLNIKYQPLSQSIPSDDEDEGFDDNILYDSRLVNGPKMDRRNVFELEKLGQPRVTSPPNIQFMGRGRRTVVLVAVLLVILLGVAAAVGFPVINHLFNHGIVIETIVGQNTADWMKEFNNTWTESSIRMIDVNNDRMDDIVIALTKKDLMDSLVEHAQGMVKYCSSIGSSYPCGGVLLALRGDDGRELWKAATRSVAVHHVCGGVDVNGDGRGDCIVTGRHSTCQAVDIVTGKILWVIDPESREWSNHFNPLWTVYLGPTVQDLDQDDVMDLIILHSPDKESWSHIPSSGRLIILSGKTGLPIGKSYFELPTKTESQMPPVMYTTPTQAIYILYGLNTESTQGKVMAISLPELYYNVTEKKMTGVDVTAYNWPLRQTQVGSAYVLLTISGGILAPPVLADMNNDGSLDILVTSVDGNVTLLDGQTLTQTWTRLFPGMVTYSSPTPGYYDSDSTLDFILHLHQGVPAKHRSSQTVILNGKDGSTMWSHQGHGTFNSSDLSLKTLTGTKDVFLLKLSGRNTSTVQIDFLDNLTRTSAESEDSSDSGTTADKEFEFKHMCDEIRQRVSSQHALCDDDLQLFTQELFLMDSFVASYPLKILEHRAHRHHYRLRHEVGTNHCHDLSPRQKDKIDMCTVLVPTSHTGAVGDVDGDGSLDYVDITQMLGSNHSDTFVITGQFSNIILSKHSIKTAIAREDFTSLSLTMNLVELQSTSDSRQHVKNLEFLPASLQVWTQYLGVNRTSVYSAPHR